ncbi:MAG TPA: hypothetical protein VFI84_00310 [Candidatus Saccharimonadales bacterium]|nr:hypothetical protein [Candidatus Saccharimonadales bacterium]
MKTNTTIEINGKRYDAVSGLPLNTGKSAKSIDGVVRSAAATATAPAAPAPKSAAMVVRAKAHGTAGHRKAHVPSPSHTLMRQVVKKPSKSQLAKIKVQPRTDILIKDPSIVVEPKLSVASPDPKRTARANHVVRSKLISRFGEVHMHRPIISSSVLDITSSGTAILDVAPPSDPPARPAIPPSQQRSMDIFQKALAHATSHEQKPSRAKHATMRAKGRRHGNRIASVSSAALAVLIIGGFLAYQNVANVTVRLASTRAGFAASLPAYKPSGFSVGKFAYHTGNVTINFHSNSDQRAFALVEQPSEWNSETLLNEFVATKSSDYQTVQTAGRTVYIYGQNNATWVASGVWYQVNTQGSLSTSQLVNLASSM